MVTRPKESAAWLEKPLITEELEQIGLPVTHLVGDDAPTARFALRGVLLTVGVIAAGLIALVLSLYFLLR